MNAPARTRSETITQYDRHGTRPKPSNLEFLRWRSAASPSPSGPRPSSESPRREYVLRGFSFSGMKGRELVHGRALADERIHGRGFVGMTDCHAAEDNLVLRHFQIGA